MRGQSARDADSKEAAQVTAYEGRNAAKMEAGMPTELRSIHIEMDVYLTVFQDTPAGKKEVEDARKFIDDVEAAAEKRLPGGRHSVRITETRERKS